MKIAISGSHGLIGTYLVNDLRLKNHTVTRIVRSKDTAGIFWDPNTNYINQEKLESFDAIINLCGNNIASINPFSIKKELIYSSRVGTNLLLSRVISKLKNPPKYFISASGCSIYNSSKNDITENTDYGKGFLTQLALDWEEASRFYNTPKTKVINLRFGQVISKESLFLKIMKNLVNYLRVSSIGSGNQYWPWISINDVIGIMHFIINSNFLEGPINIVSPQKNTSKEFLRKLAQELNVNPILNLPSPLIKLGANKLASQILLNNYPVVPEKLQQNNYNFIEEDLSETLKNLIQNLGT
ncbi:MAG: TIGR01777 family oxidoreductase [Chloroflexota bacterium]|nr:TIGR01777 family oxidoreductase [Chloroflexota bacterium]